MSTDHPSDLPTLRRYVADDLALVDAERPGTIVGEFPPLTSQERTLAFHSVRHDLGQSTPLAKLLDTTTGLSTKFTVLAK